MSIHSSFKSSNTMKRHRSVLSKLERVKILSEKGEWDPESSSMLGLPKVKHIKLQIKKGKAASEDAAGAEGQAASPDAAGKAPEGAAGKSEAGAAGKATAPEAKSAGAPGKK